jgi:putative transcriptional regulator
MKPDRIKINKSQANTVLRGRINVDHVDATTEVDIARQIHEDDIDAMFDAAKYARRVRRRLGFSQTEFAKRIHVSLDTIRNWEQGKRSPTGAAKALLQVLDKSPEAALAALN